VDYDDREDWQGRWLRKTDEWGEGGAKAACRIGRTLDQGWWLALEEGLQQREPGPPSVVETRWNRASWREDFQDFCLKMEIPVLAPHWYLVAGAPLT
jgi:hypothetical protein